MSLISRHIPSSVELPQWAGRSHWELVGADDYSVERQLRLLDREMQRLAGDMTRLYSQAGLTASTRPTTTLLREGVTGADLPLSCPPGFVADVERWWAEREALLGADSHAETWRQKENFLLDNPVVRDSQGRPQFRLQFDLRQFKPEEVTVRTIGQQLIVQARHEEAGPDKKVHREYCRQCTLPGDVTPEALVSRLSRSGILTIHAPLPAGDEDRVIPIDRC